MTCLPLRLIVIPREIDAAFRVEPVVGPRAGAYDDDDEETFYRKLINLHPGGVNGEVSPVITTEGHSCVHIMGFTSTSFL